MRLTILVALLALVTGCGGVTAKSRMHPDAALYPAKEGNICMLAGLPPSGIKYEVLGTIVATKRSYGSSYELFPPMAAEARKFGADAVMNLQASQRFKGPLPWRAIAPTGNGQAIRLLPESPKFDCQLSGGRVVGPNGLVMGTSSPDALSAQSVQQSESAAAKATDSVDANSEPDLYSELMKLDDLRQKGILTQAEFEAQKKKLLESS